MIEEEEEELGDVGGDVDGVVGGLGVKKSGEFVSDDEEDEDEDEDELLISVSDCMRVSILI